MGTHRQIFTTYLHHEFTLHIFTTNFHYEFHACSENLDFHDIFTMPVVKIQIFTTFSWHGLDLIFFSTNISHGFSQQSGFSQHFHHARMFTTPCFKQNYTFYSNPSYASQSILTRLSPNLHKVGLIFRDDRNKGHNPMFWAKLHIFINISVNS